MDESINQPVYVSGIFTAHHQAVCAVYVQQLVGVTGSWSDQQPVT
jgi:hypothetical protein